MQIQQAWAYVNGTQLYYEVAGNSYPLMLIHGFTLDTRMWDDQFELLAQQYQVIRYDLRGFGQSAVPTADSYSHVEDLRALLDYLQLEQAHCIGLSKGGAIVLDFALTYPDRAKTLVLIDTVLSGHNWSAEGSARDSLVWQMAQSGGIPVAKESWLTHPLFAPALRQPTVAARLSQIIADYSGWHFVNTNPERNMEPPAAQRLAEIQMPTLVIIGEYDLPDFQQIALTLEQKLMHVHKLLVPHAGHMANMEAPQVVNEAILQFLATA